jgi:hypothetical protein
VTSSSVVGASLGSVVRERRSGESFGRVVRESRSGESFGRVVRESRSGESFGRVVVTLSVAVIFEMVARCGRSASLLFSIIYITYYILNSLVRLNCLVLLDGLIGLLDGFVVLCNDCIFILS